MFVRVGGLLLCFEALEGGWCLCVSTPHTSASGDWRVATGFISPPKFCFTPEPVYLDTKRRRQSSVPFSGHSSRAV